MARIAPTVCKLVQGTQMGAPVVVLGMRRGPSFDFFEQGQALSSVLCRVFFHLL